MLGMCRHSTFEKMPSATPTSAPRLKPSSPNSIASRSRVKPRMRMGGICSLRGLNFSCKTLILQFLPVLRPGGAGGEPIHQPFQVVYSFFPAVLHPITGRVIMPVNHFLPGDVVASAVHLAFVQVGVPGVLIHHDLPAAEPGLVADLLRLLTKRSVAFFRHPAQPVPMLTGHKPQTSLKA